MNRVTVFKISLIISFAFNLLGAYFKIAHYPYGNILLWIGLIVSLAFIVQGITDVFRNDTGRPMEKFMWTVGFIFMSLLAGLLYYPKYIKRNL